MNTMMKDFLTNRFFKAYFLVSIGLLFTFGVQSYFSYKAQEASSLALIEKQGAILAASMTDVLNNIDIVLKNLSFRIQKEPRLIRNFPADEIQELKKSMDLSSSVELRIADDKGDLLSRTDTGKKLNIGIREFFQILKDHPTDNLFVSKPELSRISKNHISFAARRITAKDGRFLGVAYAILPDQLFDEMAVKWSLSKTDLINVSIGNPPYIAYRNIDKSKVGEKLETTKKSEPFHKGKTSHYTTVSESNIDHKVRAIALVRIPQGNMIFAYGEETSVLMKNWREGFLVSCSLLFLFLSVGFALVYTVYRKDLAFQKQNAVLTASAKMAALGEMAGGIAHEINNPLALIKLKSEQLSEEFTEAAIDTRRCKELSQTITKTSERIERIVRGLKVFSRKDENKSYEPVAVQEIMHETLSLCTDRFRSEFVDFHTSPYENELYIHGNQTQITQVLVNLLNNASDAIKDQKEKRIDLDVKVVNDTVEIWVTDNGPGISPQNREKIFQPFFTTKEQGKGTGLGLSISYGIMQSHNGSLYIDPQSKNTRFVLSLPLYQKNNIPKVA